MRIVLVLGVLGGGAAAYYYLWHLPRTPRAVLTEYLALQQARDYDGTYALLSEKSRNMIRQDRWRWMWGKMRETEEQHKISYEYTLSEPTFAEKECRIPVTTKIIGKAPQPEASAARSMGRDSFTQRCILVKEEDGWKVGYLEQLTEQTREFGRKAGLTPQQIKQSIKRMEWVLMQPPPGSRP